MINKYMLLLLLLSIHAVGAAQDAIQPCTENPRYWQYRGQPVLLLGGSKTDHIFLLDDLEAHLDAIAAVGGNYVRCTMSQREGADLKPHKRLPDGTFDLRQWNEDYWQRFERCLTLCTDRNIIVQIELWDRFDYSKEQWQASAWRPANNVNYSAAESGLANQYPQPAHRDKQPFFHTLAGSRMYRPSLAMLVPYQEAFVAKVLSISLRYDNVLYCVGNESSAPQVWSQHWARRATKFAAEQQKTIYITQMYDQCRLDPIIAHPDIYNYLEGSKILGPRRQQWAPKGEGQWHKTLSILEATRNAPKPLNTVKIITNQDPEQAAYSVRKFWRGLMAGMAAIRFHREPGGSGFSKPAQQCIQSVRKLETLVSLWDTEATQDLLQERELDEAYLRAAAGKAYALYFPNGGAVGLDLRNAPGTFHGRWIDIATGAWGASMQVTGDAVVPIATPDSGCWALVLRREPAS